MKPRKPIIRPVLPQPIFYGDIVYPSPTMPDCLNFRSMKYPGALSNWPAKAPYAVGDIRGDGSRVVAVKAICDPRGDCYNATRWFWRMEVEIVKGASE